MFACKLNTDPDQPVAIELVFPDSGRVEVTDTFRPSGWALNGVGDSVAVQLFWSSLDTAVIAVLDSTTGVSLSKTVGAGRLQARAGNLFSNPQTVTVLAKLESVQAAGPTQDTIQVTPDSTEQLDSLSVPLQVEILATGGTASSRRVVYSAATFPAGGPVVTFVPNDSVLTNSVGVGASRLRLLAGADPDSVVITASVQRLNGAAIAGSPVKFVVEFGP